MAIDSRSSLFSHGMDISHRLLKLIVFINGYLPPFTSPILLSLGLMSFLLYFSPTSLSLRHTTKSLSETPWCDYTTGEWIPDSREALYNESCSYIYPRQRCATNGKPNTDYLYWRWKPDGCSLPRFDPQKFLRLLANKRLAIIGDSLARNHMESLTCMLSSVDDTPFAPHWFYASHNFTASVFWSPFFVHTVNRPYPVLPDLYAVKDIHLESADETWASKIASLDVIFFTAGHHWPGLKGFFYDGDNRLLGCTKCSEEQQGIHRLNYTEAFRKSIRTSFATIKSRARSEKQMLVFVTPVSPSHFDGPWNDKGKCPQTKPYKRGEVDLKSIEKTMRQIVFEEVEVMKRNVQTTNITVDVFDVTGVSSLRPDGHAGPYHNHFPSPEQMDSQNDCLHWCMPGVIDTWSEIMVELIQRKFRLQH